MTNRIIRCSFVPGVVFLLACKVYKTTDTSSARKLSDVLEGDVVAIDCVQRLPFLYVIVVVDKFWGWTAGIYVHLFAREREVDDDDDDDVMMMR